MTEMSSRKRIRSQEEDSALQLKYFVNQQLVDKSDKNLMKQVYEKTLQMIFAGAKAQSRKSKDNEDPNQSLVLDTVDDKLPESKGCKLCLKDVEPNSNCICKNCNLKICSSCNVTCANCCSNLCSNCVNLFNCSVNDVPICEDCKYFIN